MDNDAKPTILLLVERWEVPAAESGVSFPLLSTLGGTFFFCLMHSPTHCMSLTFHSCYLYPQYGLSDIGYPAICVA